MGVRALLWVAALLFLGGCEQSEAPAPRSVSSCGFFHREGECPDGRTCSDGVCTLQPRAWCDCPVELGCLDGDCVELGTDNACGPAMLTGACADGEVCVVGNCTPIELANVCAKAMPTGLCPSGASCQDGVCLPMGDAPCSSDRLEGLCPAGQRCRDGECGTVACSPEQPVGACAGIDEYCREGVCALLPCSSHHLAGFCEGQSFCSVSGECLETGHCAASDDCSEGFHCVTGELCLPEGECVAAADCDVGQGCAVAGRCIDAGDCVDERDCAAEQTCSIIGVCLDPGECAASLDCEPGSVCVDAACVPAVSNCTTNEWTTLGCEDDLYCCPEGEVCCPGRERCSDGICIHHSQCLDGDDCASAGFVCSEYSCAPTESCDDPCVEGQYCSDAQACIDAGGCAVDSDCPPDAICTPLFECRVHTDAVCAGCFATVVRGEQASGDTPCTLPLPLTAIGRIYVYLDPLDGTGLERVLSSPDDGWQANSDTAELTLQGSSCDRTVAGDVMPVVIGCHLCE